MIPQRASGLAMWRSPRIAWNGHDEPSQPNPGQLRTFCAFLI